MTEGFVTFVNNNDLYIHLTDILIESVERFTDKQIEVFSINFDYKSKSEHVIPRKVSIEGKIDFALICYIKLFASLNSTFDSAIQLDGDMIVTPQSLKLFEESKRIKNMPLGSKHPHDPDNQQHLMSLLNVSKKTQPYLHATYLFNNSCKSFFEECLKTALDLYNKGVFPPNLDETIYNVMLWKYNSNDYLDCYDPYYDYFVNRSEKNKLYHGYKDNVNHYICHGCKDVLLAREILNNIIK
jgi:hypothetical protein